MLRIAVIGDRESVYGYAALGLNCYFTVSGEDNTALFKRLCQSQNYGIIYVTEAAAEELEKEIAKLRSQPTPAVILIPGASGNTGEGLRAVKLSVEKAVGSDIFND